MMKRSFTGFEVIVVTMLVTSVVSFIDHYDLTKELYIHFAGGR